MHSIYSAFIGPEFIPEFSQQFLFCGHFLCMQRPLHSKLPAAGLLTGIYSAAGNRSGEQSAKSAKSGPRGPPTMAIFFQYSCGKDAG
jgi:hypothetical protein